MAYDDSTSIFGGTPGENPVRTSSDFTDHNAGMAFFPLVVLSEPRGSSLSKPFTIILGVDDGPCRFIAPSGGAPESLPTEPEKVTVPFSS